MSTPALFSASEPGAVFLPEAVPSVSQGIVSRTVLAAPGLRAVLFHFAAGQELTEHTSTSRALIHILSGACDFLIEGKPQAMRAGELLHLPPRRPHAVKATEPMTMLLVLAPEPAGEA